MSKRLSSAGHCIVCGTRGDVNYRISRWDGIHEYYCDQHSPIVALRWTGVVLIPGVVFGGGVLNER